MEPIARSSRTLPATVCTIDASAFVKSNWPPLLVETGSRAEAYRSQASRALSSGMERAGSIAFVRSAIILTELLGSLNLAFVPSVPDLWQVATVTPCQSQRLCKRR